MLKCGLLGEKLGHTYSPSIHAMLGDYEYALYEKTPEEAERFLRSGAFDGLNVTIPYKKLAAAVCTELSPIAQRLGSVNTVAARTDASGRRILYGDNTDYAGFAALVSESGICVNACKCLVLGSGGASLSVQAALKDLGAAEVVVISRSGAHHYGNLDRHADAQILVNATPVGMYPNNGKAPLDLSIFGHVKAVFDLIYNPRKTALMLQAESLGIPAFGGLYMLVAQAEAASRVFMAQDPERAGTAAEDSEGTEAKNPDQASADAQNARDRIRAIYESLDKAQQNIVLIGMPGSGKSTVAKALAKRTGREVLDSDEEIAKRAGLSIPQIFAQKGEAAFRDMETDVLCDLGKRSGCILATGGGCVTREENAALLRQNGRIVWVKRELSLLETDGRPLSMTLDVNQIYVNREPQYQAFSDVCVVNDARPEDCAALICKELGI